jgi:proteasome lid subunit RPN8/RPN11
VLRLPRSAYDTLVAHARRDHPDECCGVLSGRDEEVSRVFVMANAERSPTGFSFDPAEQLRVWRDIDDADEELLVVYHSHTATEAFPSRTDVRWSANTPGVHWLLVSTREPDATEVRSFLIDAEGTIAEEELTVVDG